MPVIPFGSHSPMIHDSAFIAPGSWIIGDVEIGEDATVFFNAVLRGDIESIRIGRGTNIQEHVLIHTSHGLSPAIVGENVTVGHRAIIHGCSVGNLCLIGMGATLLDNAVIGEGSIIGAHTLIPKGVEIPPYSLVVGTPGRVIRQVTEEERTSLLESAVNYQRLGAEYRRILQRD